MLEPLKQFICDTCSGVIETPKDGWIEWIQRYEKDQQRNYNFRICHRSKCPKLDNKINSCSGHLDQALENNSMYLQLLDMLSSPGAEQANPEDVPGIVEMTRRLTLPYYEEARKHLNHQDYSGPYDYMPDQLKYIISENSED